MFYVYTIDTEFLNLNIKRFPFKVIKTKNIEKASYWIDKKTAKTWSDWVKSKYPNAKLREAKLTLK